MNNAFYLPLTKKRNEILLELVKQKRLAICTSSKKEKVLKNENMIMMVRSKYMYIRFFSNDESYRNLPEMKSILGG